MPKASFEPFPLVSNIETSDLPRHRQVNERVLHARLADAGFFRSGPRQGSKRGAEAGNVVTIASWGRNFSEWNASGLAGQIADTMGADCTDAARGLPAKADLLTIGRRVSGIAGLMGRYYAEHDDEVPEAAAAIEQHYWPVLCR
jgi:glycyl-tRNA synthetase beta chain